LKLKRINFDDFTKTDKQTLVEIFVSHPVVMKKMYKWLFPEKNVTESTLSSNPNLVSRMKGSSSAFITDRGNTRTTSQQLLNIHSEEHSNDISNEKNVQKHLNRYVH